MGVYEAISERWGKAATERRIAEAYAKGVADERARQEAQRQQDRADQRRAAKPG